MSYSCSIAQVIKTQILMRISMQKVTQTPAEVLNNDQLANL